MENTNVLDLVAVGLALIILIGASLMMNTTILTTKRNKSDESK
jgi:hypothetical protein